MKVRRIPALVVPMLLTAAGVWAATSGWGVDAPLTSGGNMLQTAGSYMVGGVAVSGMAIGLALHRDWHHAVAGGFGGLAGGALLHNTNATLALVGSSPGVTLHMLPHTMTLVTVLRHLVI